MHRIGRGGGVNPRLLSPVLSRSMSFRRHAEPGVHTPGSPKDETLDSPGMDPGFPTPHFKRITNARCVNVWKRSPRGAEMVAPSSLYCSAYELPFTPLPPPIFLSVC